MIRNVIQLDIKRPVEEVFDYITDHINMGEWIPQILKSEDTSDGGPQPGATFSQLIKSPGPHLEMTFEIVEYQPPRKYVYKSTTGPVPVWSIFDFERQSAGSTQLTYTEEVNPTDFLSKLMKPYLKRLIRKKLKADFLRLKAVLETKAQIEAEKSS